jgi:hypothetical protein
MHTTIVEEISTHLEEYAQFLVSVLPWVSLLTDPERAALLADLSTASMHFKRTGERQMLLDVLEDWAATARLLEDPQMLARVQARPTEQETLPWEAVRADVPRHPAP